MSKYGNKDETSFPELVYPSLRDILFKSPYTWLEGKVIDDRTEGLWRIHDSLYDFTDFMDKHPGGFDWLMVTKGTDITEAFESHHITMYPESMLGQYFVKKVTTKRNSPFTFKDNGFYRTLKNRVREELPKIPKNLSDRSKIITDSLALTTIVCSIGACLVQEMWAKSALCFIAALCMAWTCVCSHNFIHQRDNWRMYLLYFISFPVRDFRIMHALSHHQYPNTLMDFEISGAEPFFQWLPRKSKTFLEKYSPRLYFIFVYTFLFDIAFITRYIDSVVRRKFHYFNYEDFLLMGLPLAMFYGSNCDLEVVLTHWWIINHIGLFMYSMIGINAAHHHPDIFHDGDAPLEDKDWGLHQLNAVMDRVDVNESFFQVLTSFGEHGLHHLFPALDHAILPRLHPIFLKTCKEFKTELRMSTRFELILGQFQQLARTESKKRPNL